MLCTDSMLSSNPFHPTPVPRDLSFIWAILSSKAQTSSLNPTAKTLVCFFRVIYQLWPSAPDLPQNRAVRGTEHELRAPGHTRVSPTFYPWNSSRYVSICSMAQPQQTPSSKHFISLFSTTNYIYRWRKTQVLQGSHHRLVSLVHSDQTRLCQSL